MAQSPAIFKVSYRGWLCGAVLITLILSIAQWVIRAPDSYAPDLIFYLTIGQLFIEQLQQGEWFPRFLYDANAGMGTPVFWIYGPLPYYLQALVSWVVPGDTYGLNLFNITCMIMMLATLGLHYFWLREHVEKDKAALTTCIFAVAPYRILLLLLQSSMSTLLAFACLVAAMWSAERLMKHRPYAWFGLMLGISGILLSHPTMVLVFAWLPFLYIGIRAYRRDDRVRIYCQTFGALVAAIGLTSFYWLPALYALEWMKAEHIAQDALRYMGTLSKSFADSMLPFAILMLLGAWFSRKMTDISSKPYALTILVSVSLVVILGTPLSVFLWQHISLLQNVQMPHRFYAIGLLWSGVAYLLIRPYKLLKYSWNILLVALFLVFYVSTIIYLSHVRNPDVLEMRQYAMILPPGDIQSPPYTNAQTFNFSELQKLAHRPETLWVTQGKAETNLERTQLDQWQLTLTVHSKQATLVVKKYLYNTLYLVDEASGKNIELVPDPQGLAQFTLSNGHYRLIMSYRKLPHQNQAEIISALTGVLVLAILSLQIILRRKAGFTLRRIS